MFDDLITHSAPPPNRIGKCDDDQEHHLPEGAVMVAFAMHLLRAVPGVREVAIHPDGEHGKRFDFQGWLGKRGFIRKSSMGTTQYGGVYVTAGGQTVVVNPSSGRGDVVADAGRISIVAECKGGIINTRHPGQLSRLRQGLCETVGYPSRRRSFQAAGRSPSFQRRKRRKLSRGAWRRARLRLESKSRSWMDAVMCLT